MSKKICTMLMLLLLVTSARAEHEKYDGLQLLVSGETLVDEQSNSTMTLHGFAGKYDQKLVGIYLVQHGEWGKLKADLLKTRDEWQTISPTQFALTGEVDGYRVGTAVSTMRISIEGENALDNKRLAFSLNGGGNTPRRVFASITLDQVKTLADQFHRVDEAIGNP